MTLKEAIKYKFRHHSIRQLIARIENAADFRYDDECFELKRRLKEQGLQYRWKPVEGCYPKEIIEIYDPQLTTGKK